MKNKLSTFPGFSITSVLFLVYFVSTFFLLYIDFSNSSNLSEALSPYLVPAPYLVMAIFTLNSKEKPGIGFSIACLINVPLIIYLNMGVWQLWNIGYLYYGGIGTVIRFVFWWLSFLLSLTSSSIFGILGILSKFIKMPNKLFKLWFLFPLPIALFFLSEITSRFIGCIFEIVNHSLNLNSFMSYLIYSIVDLILVAAFFAVAYRLKSADENTEVAVNYYNAQ